MLLQVLVSTVNQTDISLLKKMDLQSEAIIINQCNSFSFRTWKYRGKTIEWYNFPERGIGLSRNNALMRAYGDILLFADDDVTYAENYSEIIINEFMNHPSADVIIFNLKSTNLSRPEYQNTHFHRLHFFNCLKYGTMRMAVKREQIFKKNISFSMIFGGGTVFGSGEDSVFLIDCLKKGLKIYASPCIIGKVSHKESTWFTGYNPKYFYDKGALFACIFPFLTELLCLQLCLHHKGWFTEISMSNALKYMRKGIRAFKEGKETVPYRGENF